MFVVKLRCLGLCLLVNHGVFAGTVGPISTETSAYDWSHWSFGGKGIYLQPALNDERYVSARDITSVYGTSAKWNGRLNYSWGFFLEGAYHYHPNNDINLNWYHLRNQFTNNFITFDNTQAGKSLKPQWDGVNLEFGKLLTLDHYKNVRLHAGVHYANLGNNTVTTNLISSIDGITVLPEVSISGRPTYNGFGPRFGTDFALNTTVPVNIYAHVAGSLLAGTNRYNKTLNYPDFGVATVSKAATMHVVPELDAKLGGTYQYQTSYGRLVVDGGWMFVNYWNALNNLDPSDIGAVFTTNVAFQGPYVGLQWHGD
jgi:hypothetical protein